jgi:hypothetical protein
MLTVPFTMHIGKDNETGFAAEFVVGFVGLSQQPITLSVKPEIDWFVKQGMTPPSPKKS